MKRHGDDPSERRRRVRPGRIRAERGEGRGLLLRKVSARVRHREGRSRSKGRAFSRPGYGPGSRQQLGAVLRVAEADFPHFYPLVLFLVDTGARLGEALALRWIDVDLEAGTARIARSFSSGRTLGPTKTGRERVVELSSRLRSVLFDRQPTVFPPPETATVFPNFSGGMLIPEYAPGGRGG